MAQKSAQPVTTQSMSRRRAWRRVSAVPEGDLRLAAVLARDRLRRALPADVALALPRVGCDHRAAQQSASTATSPRRERLKERVRRRDRGLREGAGRRARPRPGDRQRDARAGRRARAEAARKELDAKLNAQLAEAEKTIAATRTAAMANVRGIATDAAAAIVERLIGARARRPAVASAVDDVLKR